MNVEAENAVMREQARIREAVVQLLLHKHGHVELIKRSEVLAILNGAGALATVQDESTIKPAKKIPWQVRAEIKKLGDHTFFESKGKVDTLISRNEVLDIITKYEK